MEHEPPIPGYRVPPLRRAIRIGVLIAAAAAIALWALLSPPLTQSIAYHDFADSRRLFGVPNFWDVLTNLSFLLVGVAGLTFLMSDPRVQKAFQDPRERWA